MALTKATITIEVEIPVSGNWCPPDKSVGIMEGWFEDAQIDFPNLAFLSVSVKKKTLLMNLGVHMLSFAYADQIQAALVEARADRQNLPNRQ